MISRLTTREIQILELMTLGYSNVQIAQMLSITLHTVKAHVQAILYKINVRNRVQAAVIGCRLLNISPETVQKIKEVK